MGNFSQFYAPCGLTYGDSLGRGSAIEVVADAEGVRGQTDIGKAMFGTPVESRWVAGVELVEKGSGAAVGFNLDGTVGAAEAFNVGFG